MAERYWKELRPSSAARLRLDASIRTDRKPTDRDLHRPRPKPRTAARYR